MENEILIICPNLF